MALTLNSCRDAFDFDLPDSNSIADTVLPTANFSYASALEDFRTVKFTNLSLNLPPSNGTSEMEIPQLNKILSLPFQEKAPFLLP